MQRSILFIPASIRSHIVPALYLADVLSKDYCIHFAVTGDELLEIVTSHGYNAIRTEIYRVSRGMENRFIQEQKRKYGKWETLKSVWNNDIYHFRRNELRKIIDLIDPAVIFIDIFNSSDILVLRSNYQNTKILFLNPMLSTYRIDGFPTVDQGHWTGHTTDTNNRKQKETISSKSLISDPIDYCISKAMERQFKKLISTDAFFVKHPVATDKTSALIFDNIPEILLAPLELEVSPKVRKANQHYFGLCISSNRNDTELDPSFDQNFEQIIAKKNAGKRLIYCTFGTFYQGSDRALVEFLDKLLNAIKMLENVEVIFSVNKFVTQTLKFQRNIPTNIHMFSRVPQLKVLKHSDLFVTHGGLGSIKESIHFGIPMLVYPLDLRYDQNGNGFKVEYHGLGLRGVFQHERSEDMKRKMQELLANPIYGNNIKQLQQKCSTNYSSDKLKDTLNQIVLN
nr:glycosyltransferase [uncultured Dyadobacter sp.]